MSPNSKEGSTHTGKAFLEFAYDLLAYTIPNYGLEWDEPPHFERSSKRVFRESFGDAIMLFHDRHAKEYEDRLNQYFDEEGDGDIVAYVEQFCKATFKENTPLMEFIVYCAFLLDIGLYYLELEDPDELYHVLDESFGVFYKYIHKYFSLVGGWHALFQVAEQFVNFITLASDFQMLLEVSKL